MLTSDLLLSKGAAAPSCMDDRPLPSGGARLTVTAAGVGSGVGTGGGSGHSEPSEVLERSVRAQSERARTQAGETPNTCAHGAHGAKGRAGAPRARLSVRLDPQRHLRLRLLAAHKQAHIQDILVEALDDYVARMAPSLGLETCQCLTSEVIGGDSDNPDETV